MANLLLHLAVAAVACVSLALSAHSSRQVVSMATGSDAGRAKPVNVTVYYETLCPGCVSFIHGILSPLWPKVKDVNLMTVNLLPFGNAEEKKLGFLWHFYCQHGAKECQGNTVEACILHYYPDTTKQLEIIGCFSEAFFKTEGKDWRQSLQKCKSTGVDVEKISTCAAGHEGNNLQHEIAARTGPHEYTPYVMLNGVPNKDAIDHLLVEVCKAYTGPMPAVCQ